MLVFIAAGMIARADTLLVVFSGANTVERISSTGEDLGVFTSTGLNNPQGIACDLGGNIYIANQGNGTITKYASDGTYLGLFANGGLSQPEGMAFDAAGNLCVADFANDVVVRFSPAGVNLGNFVGSGDGPWGLAFDPQGNLYTTMFYGDNIVRYSASDILLGTMNVPAGPRGLAFDSSGDFYVACYHTAQVEKYASSGQDLGPLAISGLGAVDGLCIDSGGFLYVCDSGNNAIHKVSPTGQDLGTLISTGTSTGPTMIIDLTTSLTAPTFAQRPSSLTVTAGQNAVFTADANGLSLTYQWQFNGANLTNNATVTGANTPKLTLSGVTTANAGNYTLNASNADGNATSLPATLQVTPVPPAVGPPYFLVACSSTDAVKAISASGQVLGAFTSSNLSSPMGIATDAGGNVYVVNSSDHTIEKYSPTGQDLGPFASANLTNPLFDAFDAAGNLYVTDAGGNTVVRFASNGAYLGVFAATQGSPHGLAFDAGGNLYVAEWGATAVEEFSANGTSLGAFVPASFLTANSMGLAFDHNGNLYVSNLGTLSVSKFSPSGVALGQIKVAGLAYPEGMYFDAGGNLYLCDNGNEEIHKISPTDQDLGVWVSLLFISRANAIVAAPFTSLTAPAITQQPSMLTVTAGQNAVFTGNASGLGLAYQWQFNGANLTNNATVSGANTTKLTLEGVTAVNVGNYTLAVSNTGGAVTSSPAPLLVNPVPAPSTPPIFLATLGPGNLTEAFSSSGQDLGSFAGTNLNYPQGIVADTSGNLYVVNESSHAIEKFSPAGQDLGPFISSNLTSPISVVLDASGNFYVADSGANQVVRFSPSGAYLGVFASTRSGPWGLAFDSSGNLYVSDQRASVVEKFSANGTNLGIFASSNVNHPTGVAFDRNGNLYTTNQAGLSNAIEKFSPSGVDLGPLVINNGIGGSAGLFFDSGGNLYVGFSGNNTYYSYIFKFSPTDQPLGAFGSTSKGSPACIIAAPFTTLPAPGILQQPSMLSVNDGQTAAFSATGYGVGLVYQWQFDGANLTDSATIAGANTTTLTLTGVTAANAGNYTLLVSNGGGTATSVPVSLQVQATPPVETTQTFLVTCEGSNAVEGITSNGQDLGAFATSGLSVPQGMVQDAQGNTYVVNALSKTIEKFSPSGADLGPWASGNMTKPISAAMDAAGNIYVTDFGADCVVHFSPNGTYLGVFATTKSGPWGLTFDAAGNLYVADEFNSVIEKFSPNGTNLGVFVQSAWMPTGLAFDHNGNLYVTSVGMSEIDKYSPTGLHLGTLNITTGLDNPTGMFFDRSGYLYVCESNDSRIHRISPADQDLGPVLSLQTQSGPVSIGAAPVAPPIINRQPFPLTVTSGQAAQFSVLNNVVNVNYQWQLNGANLTEGGAVTGSNTSILRLSGVTSTNAGNYTVFIWNTLGNVTSAAGVLTVNPTPPSPGPQVFLASLSRNNVVEAYASTGQDLGPFATGNLSNPQGLAFDQQGYLYVVNYNSGLVEKFSSTGADLGPLSIWNFNRPVSDAIGTSGNLYVTSALYNQIYWFSTSGNSYGFFAETEGSPWGVAFANSGNLFVTDNYVNVVQEFSANGTNLGVFASNNLQHPTGLAFDRNGNLYVASQGTHSVEKFSAAGEDLGPLAIANLGSPNGLMFDSGGNLYICDGTNSTIRKVSPADEDLGIFTTTATNATCMALGPFAPSISQQPAAETVLEGTPAQFSVSVIGFEPEYQWQFNGANLTDGGTISGSNTSTLKLSAVALADAGNYSVLVTTAGGNLASSPALLQVTPLPPAPTITVQPGSRTVRVGQSANFTAGASSSFTPTWQWQLSTNGGATWSNVTEGGMYAGSTTNTLTVDGTTFAASGTMYRLLAINPGGSTASNGATLTVNSPPFITTQPANAVQLIGQPASFSVTAEGTGVLTYQWQFNGKNLAFNATAATYTVARITSADAGNYTVIVTNTWGNITSANATLSFGALPKITTAPVRVTVAAGQGATFTAAASGVPLPTLQWQLSNNNGGTWGNLTNLGNVSGATATKLVLGNVTAALNNAQLRVVAINSFGMIASNAATLIVNLPPAIFGVSATFNGNTASGNLSIGTGNMIKLAVNASGSALVYHWRLNGVAIPGAVTASYTFVGTVSGAYTVTVSNAFGPPATSEPFLLNVLTKPSIISQPEPQIVQAGKQATFSVVGSGNPPPTYLWQFNGGNITASNAWGITNATLNLTKVTSANAGAYKVILNNSQGTLGSASVKLTLK